MSFLSRNWRPLLFILLGLSAIFSAHYLLDVCGDVHMMDGGHTMGGDMQGAADAAPMRCHWSERAFQGVGGLVAFIGLVQLLFKDAGRALSLAVSGAGALMILIPLWLVPTCGMPGMVCNLSFKPGALLFGGVTLVAGLLASLQLRRLDMSEAA